MLITTLHVKYDQKLVYNKFSIKNHIFKTVTNILIDMVYLILK